MSVFRRLRSLLSAPVRLERKLDALIGAIENLGGRLIEGSSNQQSLLNDKLVAVVSRLDDQSRLLEAAITRLDDQARLLDNISAIHQGAVRRGIDLLAQIGARQLQIVAIGSELDLHDVRCDLSQQIQRRPGPLLDRETDHIRCAG